MNKTYFLITPKNQINQFICAEDRAYFSNPVRVIPQHTDEQGLVWVTDPARGHTYPITKNKLVPLNRMDWKFIQKWKEAA